MLPTWPSGWTDTRKVTRKDEPSLIYGFCVWAVVNKKFCVCAAYSLVTKAAFVLSIPWRHARGAEVQSHSFLTSALDGREWLTSSPGHFSSRKSRRYPLNRRLGGPHNRSGRCRKRKISSSYRNLNPGPSSAYPSRYTVYATSAPTAYFTWPMNLTHVTSAPLGEKLVCHIATNFTLNCNHETGQRHRSGG